MANKVKGLLVEIGGDTSGLQNALKKVNSATSSLSKELKGINSLLKLDPENVTLLNQKQVTLNESIKKTEEQLKVNKEIYDEAVKAELNGAKISEENWRAIEREIAKNEAALKKLKLEASNWTQAGRKIEEFGKKIEAVGDKISALGDKMTKKLTVPIAAGFTASIKSAVDFESAFAGVEKTVDGTAEQMEKLKKGIKDMAKEIPSSTTEIAAVAEAAGQLGIQTDNILEFSKSMIDLGNSTNLTSEEAASQLAKFANVMQMSQKDFDKLGSSIVDLGNNFATTEVDIVNMAMRLAGAGKQVGFSEGEVLGLATALSSVGIEAEMGGSAISKAMVKMENAVEMSGSKLNNVLSKTGMTLRDLELMSVNNSKEFKALSQSLGMTATEVKQLITAGTNLEDFAKVSGMSANEFKKAWKEDAAGALSSFIKGLGDTEKYGESAITMLSEMGLTEVRLRDSLLRAANSGDLFNNAIKTGNKAWEENVALTKEANKRYSTTASKFKITANRTKDLMINLGQKLLPAVNKVLEKVNKLTDKFGEMSDAEQNNLIKIGLIVAAAGPMLKIFGTLTSTVGSVAKGIGTLSQAIGVLKIGANSGVASVDTLAKVIKGLTSPVGLATMAITTLAAVTIAKMKEAEEKTRENVKSVAEGMNEFYQGIKNSEGYLSNFNETLFVSSKEQQELAEQMNEVQEKITQICKTASDERRGYTQEEITQLDEYFEKLRQLNEREIRLQNSIAQAITQQAKHNSETFQGSLDEYKVLSEQWLATAESQKEKTINKIEEQTIQEIALLNQRYGEEANMQNKAYAKEIEEIEKNSQNKIDVANKEIADITSIYAQGYLERSTQNEEWYKKLQEYNKKQEEIEENHNKEVEKIQNNAFLWEVDKKNRIENQNEKFAYKQKKNWEEMYNNMSDSQKNQLSAWILLETQTELYGGKMSDEAQKTVDEILKSFESMSPEAREDMKNVMKPMLEEMEKSTPALYTKASGIANGILSRLKKAFDIHSPSRKTRKIFNQVMAGAELGLEDEQDALEKQVNSIADKVKTDFGSIQMGALNQSVIDQTKTVFTTPTLNIYAQDELTPSKMNRIIDTVNRRLGSQY